jgi:hypothetical protein
MAATAATICHDLNKINTEDVDLYELEEQTSRISADLCQIDHNETDLEELADQTREIVANLENDKRKREGPLNNPKMTLGVWCTLQGVDIGEHT